MTSVYELLSNCEFEKDKFGRTAIPRDYYDRWHVRLNRVLWVTRNDLFILIKGTVASKTAMDYYLLTHAVFKYLPPLPSGLFTKEKIRSIRSYTDLACRVRYFDSIHRVDIREGRECQIAVSQKAAGKMSAYPFSKNFLVNIAYAGFFADVDELPDIYRAECLELYNKLEDMYRRFIEERPVNVLDEVKSYIQQHGRVHYVKLQSAMRELGFTEEEVGSAVDELANKGLIKLGDGLWLQWIG